MVYECRDPRAKVRSPNILFLVDSFLFRPSLVDELLEKHGLNRGMFATHEYIPITTALAMLKDIHERIGPEKLRQVGNKTFGAAMFPPQFDTLEKVLLALDTIYNLNHLGEVGHYHSKLLPDGAIEVRCATPYPAPMERGLVEGLASNPVLCRGKRYVVDFVETHGDEDETCVCTVRER